MRPTRLLGLGVLLVLWTTSTLRAAPPPSPLRAVPAESEIVLHVQQPGKAADILTQNEFAVQLQKIQPFRELLDSTQMRRFQQLVTHFESKLGKKWPEILQQVAGGGAVIASKLGDNAPALFVLQGTDETASGKFFELALNVLQEEVTRQDPRAALERRKHHDKETVHLGKEFNVALRGATILVSNNADLLSQSLDLLEGRSSKSIETRKEFTDAAKLLPKNPLATGWLDMEKVRKQPGGEDFYKTPRDPFLTIIGTSALIDVFGRTPYAVAGLYAEGNDLSLAVRVPKGRDKMNGGDRALNVPPDGKIGSRPLLEPKDVLFSASIYQDVSRYWTERKTLFGENEVKELEKTDNDSGKVVSAFRLSKIVSNAGTYHRFVAVSNAKTPYKRKPGQPLPAFAVITEARNPDEFAQSVEAGARGLALFIGFDYGLKMHEEKYKGCDMIAYRIPEDKERKDDPTDLRFAFEPTYVRVGDQFVVSSTMDLAKELVDLLQEEKKSKKTGVAASSQVKFYGPGAAKFLEANEDQIITQSILERAITIDEARKDVKALVDLLRNSSGASTSTEYLKDEFRFDIRLKLAK